MLGRVVLRSSTLLVETMSMARARRAQQYFGAIARAPCSLSPSTSPAWTRSVAAEQGPPAPEIDLLPSLGQSNDGTWRLTIARGWTSLYGPRQSHPSGRASEKYWRPKVLDLIKGIENQAARSAREGKGFDVAFLRSELGFLARR